MLTKRIGAEKTGADRTHLRPTLGIAPYEYENPTP